MEGALARAIVPTISTLLRTNNALLGSQTKQIRMGGLSLARGFSRYAGKRALGKIQSAIGKYAARRRATSRVYTDGHTPNKRVRIDSVTATPNHTGITDSDITTGGALSAVNLLSVINVGAEPSDIATDYVDVKGVRIKEWFNNQSTNLPTVVNSAILIPKYGDWSNTNFANEIVADFWLAEKDDNNGRNSMDFGDAVVTEPMKSSLRINYLKYYVLSHKRHYLDQSISTALGAHTYCGNMDYYVPVHKRFYVDRRSTTQNFRLPVICVTWHATTVPGSSINATLNRQYQHTVLHKE